MRVPPLHKGKIFHEGPTSRKRKMFHEGPTYRKREDDLRGTHLYKKGCFKRDPPLQKREEDDL
eukprot:c11568_g1_i3 orf=519-707(-)